MNQDETSDEDQDRLVEFLERAIRRRRIHSVIEELHLQEWSSKNVHDGSTKHEVCLALIKDSSALHQWKRLADITLWLKNHYGDRETKTVLQKYRNVYLQLAGESADVEANGIAPFASTSRRYNLRWLILTAGTATVVLVIFVGIYFDVPIFTQQTTPALIITPTSHTGKWDLLDQEHAPGCQNTAQTMWVEPYAGTLSLQCTSAGTLFVPGPSYQNAAEENLVSVNGSSAYNQQNFMMTINAAFASPYSDGTSAVVLVQTPSQQETGGYGLGINASGNWQLLDYTARQPAPTPGPIGKISLPKGQSFQINVTIQQQTLNFAVNGISLVSLPDILTDGVIGLIAYSQIKGGQPSNIIFSDFSLYQAG